MIYAEDGSAQGRFSSFDWSGVSGSSQASVMVCVAGMGARGSGAIRLTPLHLSAVAISALLCSVWWCLIRAHRAPSFSLHRFRQPILWKPCTGLAQGLGFSCGAGGDRTGLDSTKLLKGPCNFLLKDHQKEAWCFCVHDIFQYFLQRHKCHPALGFSLEVMMSTCLISIFGDTAALNPFYTYSPYQSRWQRLLAS